MTKKINTFAALALITMLSSCDLIGGIFKAGAYVGIFIVVVVLVIVFWLFSLFRRRR